MNETQVVIESLDFLNFSIPINKNDLGESHLIFSFFIGSLLYFSIMSKFISFSQNTIKKFIFHFFISFVAGWVVSVSIRHLMIYYTEYVTHVTNSIYFFITIIAILTNIVYSIIDKKFKIKYKFIILSNIAIFILSTLYHFIYINNYSYKHIEHRHKVYEIILKDFNEKQILEICHQNNIQCVTKENIEEIEEKIFLWGKDFENETIKSFDLIKSNLDEEYLNTNKPFNVKSLFFFGWYPKENRYLIIYDPTIDEYGHQMFSMYFFTINFIVIIWFYGLYALLLFHIKRAGHWKKYENEI